jgi:acetyl esterase/lipase
MRLSLYTLFVLFNRLSPKELTSRRLAAAVPYGSGARKLLDIYAPSRGQGPWPVVFFCYGGSWSEGSRAEYAFAGRAIAALGYVVVIADHRLVPEVEYPLFLDDLSEAFAWTVDNIAAHGGDPSRIALMGHSAGAYNAIMLAVDPRYLKAIGLVSHVKAFVGLSGPYDFFPFDGPVSIRVFGAVSEPRSTQPIGSSVRKPRRCSSATAGKIRSSIRITPLLLPRGFAILECRSLRPSMNAWDTRIR